MRASAIIRSLRLAAAATTTTPISSCSSISRFLSSSSSTSSHLSDSDSNTAAADFDSADFDLLENPIPSSTPSSGWDPSLRRRANEALFGKPKTTRYEEEEEEEKARRISRRLLEAALEPPDEEDVGAVKEEDQMSLSVGIIGAPNAGKSSLTNSMVGTKVAAVSRKTNTTTHEVLGVMTKGNTQICFFDTPGLMIGHHGYPYRTDVRVRVDSAWSSVDLYDVLIVIFDVHRHLETPDTRVKTLIKRLGAEKHAKQTRVLCMNKVDLVKDKKDLLTVAKEFEVLPGYERFFMLSGLKGKGVKDLIQYLMDKAVKRPWDEEPTVMTEEEIMKKISLEVVREKMLDHIHQEVPYVLEHRLMDWKERGDGSLRVEQHFITQKSSQRGILVGKNGSKIGKIGIEANEELRSIFKREVHLILKVRVAKRRNA